MESYFNDVNSKIMQRNVSTNISYNNDHTLRPEQFYNRNLEGPLSNRLYSGIPPRNRFGDDRSELQSSSFKPRNSPFQIVPSSQRFLSNVSIFNNDRDRTMIERQYSKVGETSAMGMNNQTSNNCNEYSINNGHSFTRSNGVGDHQFRRPNGGDDHQFRRPYDVRVPNSNMMDRRADMSVASSFFPTPITSMQKIKEDLTTAVSMIELMNSGMGVPLEKLDSCIQLFLFTLKRKSQKLICKTLPSNMSTISTNSFAADKMQSIQQWLNSTITSAPAFPPALSTCSTDFTSVSMQQPTRLAGGCSMQMEIANALQNQVRRGLNRVEEDAIQVPEKLQANAVVIESSTRDCDKRKTSLDKTQPQVLNRILRERKSNSLMLTAVKRPVHKKAQASRQNESPSVSSSKPIQTSTETKLVTANKPEPQNRTVSSSKPKPTPTEPKLVAANKPEPQNRTFTSSKPKPTSTEAKLVAANKPEPQNKSNSAKVKPTQSKTKNKENEPVKPPKASKKEPAKEKKTLQQTRAGKIDPNEPGTSSNEPKKQEPRYNLETTKMTTRGRVIKQAVKYWEVDRQPLDKVTDGLEIDEPETQTRTVQTAAVSRKGKRNTPKEVKEGIPGPSTDKNKAQSAQRRSTSTQRRSSSTTPKTVKQVAAKKIVSPNSCAVVKPAAKKRNTKENQPLKAPKAAKKLTAKESEKPAAAKGKKRTGAQDDESESAKKKKKLDKNPIFEDSFQYCDAPGASNYFGFEVPSPGDALNSIRKKPQPDTSGRETPPIRYLSSFLDHTGKTKSPSVVSEDDHYPAVKSHAADRIAKKMTKAKANTKPRKQKVAKSKLEPDPAVKELLNQVLDSKAEPILTKRFTTKAVNMDDSSDCGSESDFDSCEDLI